MTTTTTVGVPSDADRDMIDRVRDGLLNGRYFRTIADSNRGAAMMRPRPPSTNGQYAHAIRTLGRMAAWSDPLAQLAAGIVRNVPLYQSAPELVAAIYDAAFAYLLPDYDDVIGRTGPEAGRPSQYRRPFSLAERVQVAYFLAEATAPCADHVPTVGWCIQAIVRDERINVPRCESLK